MADKSWRQDPIQIVTVTLYDMGYNRYWVEARNKLGQTREAVVWAQSEEAIRGVLAQRERGMEIVCIEELRRDLFYAEMVRDKKFIGKNSGDVLYRMNSTGDVVIPPDWKLVADREEKAS